MSKRIERRRKNFSRVSIEGYDETHLLTELLMLLMNLCSKYNEKGHENYLLLFFWVESFANSVVYRIDCQR